MIVDLSFLILIIQFLYPYQHQIMTLIIVTWICFYFVTEFMSNKMEWHKISNIKVIRNESYVCKNHISQVYYDLIYIQMKQSHIFISNLLLWKMIITFIEMIFNSFVTNEPNYCSKISHLKQYWKKFVNDQTLSYNIPPLKL